MCLFSDNRSLRLVCAYFGWRIFYFRETNMENSLNEVVKTRKNRKFLVVISVMVLFMIGVSAAVFLTSCDNAEDTCSDSDYENACSLMDSGDYDGAMSAFDALGEYKDSVDKKKECSYKSALVMVEAEKYDEAYKRFRAACGYSDSIEQLEKFTVLYDKETVGDTVTEYTYGENGMILGKIITKGNEVRELVYDENGNRLKDITKRRDTVIYSYENTYDEAGRLLTRDYLFSSGIEDHWELTYNENGDLLLKNCVSSDGTYRIVECIYDDAGKLLKEYHKERLGSSDADETETVYEYFYDENGECVKTVKTDDKGNTEISDEYDVGFDFDFDFDFDPPETTDDGKETEKFYDESGNCIKEVTTDKNGNVDLTIERVFDEMGNKIKETKKAFTGAGYVAEYVYNEYGRIITEKVIDNHSGALTTTNYEYEGIHVLYFPDGKPEENE